MTIAPSVPRGASTVAALALAAASCVGELSEKPGDDDGPSDSAPGHYRFTTEKIPPRWQCPADWGARAASSPPAAAAHAARTGLRPSGCADLAEPRRRALRAAARSTLEAARGNLLLTNCMGTSRTVCLDAAGQEVSSSFCDQPTSSRGLPGGGVAYSPPSSPSPSTPTAVPGGVPPGARATSTTNTQIATVDEADFVKNDNRTIFVLASDGLHVIAAWPAATTREVARIPLPGEPRRMFLADDRLVVYTRTNSAVAGRQQNPSNQGCTYAYDCRFSSEGGSTAAIVFDLKDPARPVELARYEFSGGFVAARRVGGAIYTVVHDAGASMPPGVVTTLSASSYDEALERFGVQSAANDAVIDGADAAYFLPWVRKVDATQRAPITSPCTQAMAQDNVQGGSFVTLTAFDLAALSVPTRSVVAINAGFVYASPAALYLAVDDAPETSRGYGASRAQDSFIHKFALAGTQTSYVGSVRLDGHVLNQLAMDEHDGVLRVASTRGWVPDPSVSSSLSTFGEKQGRWQRLGLVSEIAPGEDIRSVRFEGPRGYVVTFKKTDPLFAFDLSRPEAPARQGELKIPGYSTYMHSLDPRHLLAIGFEADDQGDFAFFNGIQIQIFDVADVRNPRLLWKKVIGTRGSASDALTNHLAFTYFAPKKMLALPMTICEGGGNGEHGKLAFSGLMTFDVSIEKGITEHGRMPFVTDGGTARCDQWWTSQVSVVKRSIFMDDYIYGLSDTQLRVAPLSAMDKPLQVVPLSPR